MTLNVNGKDHIRGKENAPVELVEYADYECPYCGEAYQILKRVEKELGDNLKLVFRNFPLVEMHPYALHAALAAEAAGLQGKFWEMHDIIFENQDNLQDPFLMGYAKEIGLDTEKFEKDFSKEELIQKVKDDYESGARNDVQGTPTFFVNGQKFDGNWMQEEFIEYLKSFVK